MKTVVIQLDQKIPVDDLLQLPDFPSNGKSDEIYEYFTYSPSNRSIQLAISDDIAALSTIPAEQKIILGHPAPPNSNWYSVNSFKDIITMLEFDRYLTINNITIGGITYAS